jgi:hypothetical protein
VVIRSKLQHLYAPPVSKGYSFVNCKRMLVDPIAATAGAFAGVAVDLSLFPIDTIKTRLQAPGGFLANGGWRGIYKGIGSVATGSAPSGIPRFIAI